MRAWLRNDGWIDRSWRNAGLGMCDWGNGSKVGGTTRGGSRREYSLGLSGLGQHQGGIPIFFQSASEAGEDLGGHFRIHPRAFAGRGAFRFLVVHDTTEFSYKREDTAAIGLVSKGAMRKDAQGRPIFFTTCGICLHSSLAVDHGGIAPGISSGEVLERTRVPRSERAKAGPDRPDRGKGEYSLAGEPPAVDPALGQAGRCVHVGDQESDIFDLFAVAQQMGTHFLIRSRADRLADGGPENVAEKTPRRGLYRITLRDPRGKVSEVVLEIRYQRLQIQSPKGPRRSARVTQ